MAASLRFYRLLEPAIPEGVESEPHVEVTTPNGYRIAWDTLEMIKGIDPEYVENPAGQRIVARLRVRHPGGGGRVARADRRGGLHSHIAPWDAFWGMRYAVVIDPDGNTVDLFAAL